MSPPYLYQIEFLKVIVAERCVLVFSEYSINKTDHHDIIEILLKVVLNTINQTLNWRHFKKYEITNGNKFNLVMQNKKEHNIVFSLLNENRKKMSKFNSI